MRVHFTGAAGSGTTFLGQAVASQAGLSHFEADDYLWESTDPPYQHMRAPQERARLLQADLSASPQWALSGSLVRWGDTLSPLFDLVVLVLTPTEVRLARLRQRELKRFGPEALGPRGNMHQHHLEFLAWAAKYDDGDENVRSRCLHETWVAGLSCPFIRVNGELPISLLVEQVLEAIPC